MSNVTSEKDKYIFINLKKKGRNLSIKHIAGICRVQSHKLNLTMVCIFIEILTLKANKAAKRLAR